MSAISRASGDADPVASRRASARWILGRRERRQLEPRVGGARGARFPRREAAAWPALLRCPSAERAVTSSGPRRFPAGHIGAGGAVNQGNGSGGLGTGGAIDVPTAVDSGPACRNVFAPMNWDARCEPSPLSLNLDPATWFPADDARDASTDAAAPRGTTVAEAPFCAAAGKRRYTFAFEESGASYDDFNILTGNDACSGRSLAFIGVGGVGDAPLTRVRTHCFSVDGELLGSRLAIVPLDPDAIISNLRPVASCPCPYPIPYNVNTCPGVEGAAGTPELRLANAGGVRRRERRDHARCDDAQGRARLLARQARVPLSSRALGQSVRARQLEGGRRSSRYCMRK